MNLDRYLHELGVSQGGAIRLDQALDAGMTRNQIKYRLRTGRWSHLVRGSYLVTAMTTTDDHLRAAVASLPGAVVSHEAAAVRHGLAHVPRGLATVLVHTQTTHDFPGVLVRRCHDIEASHISRLDGLPTTTIPRTIVDLAAILTERHLAAVLDDAVVSRKVGVGEIADVACAVGRAGKPGTQSLRAILEQRTGAALLGTPLERMGNELLLGIEGATPEFEYPIPWRVDLRFDAAYPDHKLAIEWDSRRWHTQVAAFQKDRSRDRQAVLHGWRILRFTWEDVNDRPQAVVSAVRVALSGATHPNRGLTG